MRVKGIDRYLAYRGKYFATKYKTLFQLFVYQCVMHQTNSPRFQISMSIFLGFQMQFEYFCQIHEFEMHEIEIQDSGI